MTSAAPNSSSARVSRRKARNREQLLAAAESLFAERAFASVRMEEIAEAADVSTGSVYVHFGSKDGILLALAETLIERVTEAMLSAWDESRTPLEGFIAAGNAYMGFLVDNPVFVRYLNTEPSSKEAQAMGSVAQRGTGLTNSFEQRIQSAIDAGQMQQIDARLMSNFLFGAWNGVAALAQRSDMGTLDKTEVLACLEQAGTIILQGLIATQP